MFGRELLTTCAITCFGKTLAVTTHVPGKTKASDLHCMLPYLKCHANKDRERVFVALMYLYL